ncbi:hypothetical protein SAMN05216421_1259 [Halopseudomonas xinjiangensis]|uniref:Type IV pili methyl-accepting chemotaxis transducer N-term n=1 Tax=Halopseudomonas xinjiangensis TaxID=487184 RepID=A0A1H1R3C6_9GAMM|nr:hypothetical protein [Halopseudomonas xinjiangensis]SDS29479.1 hypothetical protein SAMN05216421_1259 [Halopseudomonas xinjiangensis]
MNSKSSMSLPAAALVGAISLALPMQSFAQKTQQPAQPSTVSIIVGHSVIDALDDVRDSTAEFIDALLDAGDRLGIDNWPERKTTLEQIRQQLDDMGRELDEKADSTDAAWLSWLGDDDSGVTVNRQIRNLGDHLSQISAMLGGSWDTRNLDIVVGHQLLDQLDELRESTADLVNALDDAGSDYGWAYDPQQIKQARTALDRMEQNLNRKREGGDADMRIFLREQEYHVLAHENIETIAQVLRSLLQPEQSSSR